MNYKIIKRESTAWSVDDSVVCTYDSMESAENALLGLYETNKADKRYYVSFIPNESLRLILRDNRLFVTMYIIERMDLL
jgi:hypothetical protein